MPSKPKLPEAEWNFTGFYGPGKEEFRKLLYYYEFGREYYNREHENNEERLAEIVESQLEKSCNNDLPEFDDAFETKTPAAKFIRELAGFVDLELHGRPTGEANSPAFRENPFCALEEDLQNRLLKSFKNQLELLTKDRIFLLNHGFLMPTPKIKKDYKLIAEKYRNNDWKELEKQILNEKDQNFIWLISQVDLHDDDSIIESQLKRIHTLLRRVREDRKVKVLNKRKRGKKNYTYYLKCLAAKRALAHYKGDFQTARENTWVINSKGEMGSLYVRNEDWVKTPEIVESVLKELFEKPPGDTD